MTELYKFSLKNCCIAVLTLAFCIAITWKSEARHIASPEIYSTLTTDTIPARKINRPASVADTVPVVPADSTDIDTLPTGERFLGGDTTIIPTTDTFSLKLSKDALDAPVEYEAADSGVLLVKAKKFLLYGNTTTTHKDITLTAPQVELDQATSILTAVNAKDSAGNIIARANFKQGDQGFQSDTIRFNFKTQRGITKNTYTKQDEFYLNFEEAKKIDSLTTFAKHFTMTTCEYDHPHFGFVGNKGKFITNNIAVTGPIHPEFEGVPIPIYLPFGIFPLKTGRKSGLLPPQFTANEQFGLGLEGLGYYQVLNEYLDVTFRSNIYSYGGWTANFIPSYRKRYRYNGSMNISMQRSKFNFKGDPDFSLVKTFNISWNHSVDQRARPGTNFSANVNAGSTRYNQFVVNDAQRPFNNQLTSSINYSKTWRDKPFNLSLSANHNQNNLSKLINITLPDAGFTVTTLYPFQRKEGAIGAPRWYEKIGVGYTGIARNQLSFYDTTDMSVRRIIDTLQWGAQHRFPINMSLPPLGPLLVSPFVSYEETWLTRRIGQEWNSVDRKIDTTFDRKGLFIDRQLSFGIGMNTALYGTKAFRKGSLRAVRHVIRPNINFNYRPNLSKKYYDEIQIDTFGRKAVVPQFISSRNLFSSYGYGRFGGITFGIDNNVEIKWKGKKDTTAEGKKIRIIDGFGITSGYNFLQDSLRLLPFNMYFRTTLFEKISITAQALYNPYQRDNTGRDINRFVWQGDRFRLGRLRSGSISMSTNFQSKPRDPDKQAVQQGPTITDPTLLGDRERLQDYMQRNPAEFVDFNIPWTINLSFSLFFSEQFRNGESFTDVSSNISFNNSFSLTPKWNFSTNGYFDFKTKRMTMFTMSINRDLHCWQMSVNVTPIGEWRSFNISISPKSSVLQDLKVNRTRTFYNY